MYMFITIYLLYIKYFLQGSVILTLLQMNICKFRPSINSSRRYSF